MFKKIAKKGFSLIKLLKIYWLSPSNFYFRKCDILIFSNDVDRSDIVNGCHFSKILDPLTVILKKSNLQIYNISFPGSKLTGEKTYGNIVNIDKSYIKNEITNKLVSFLSIRKKPNPRSFYCKLLRKTRPRLILGIGLHSEICREAKNLNIPIWEISHGFGYNPPVPWGWENKPISEVPNGILVFDEKSRKTFVEVNNLEVIVVNHPLYQDKGQQLNKFSFELESKIALLKDKINNRKVIMVILTWGYAGDHGEYSYLEGILPNGFFPNAVESAMADIGEDYFWSFRVHPTHITNKEKYARLFNKLSKMKAKYENMDWEYSSSMPLFSLLPIVNKTICMASMASYDAAIFGIKTLFMCPTLNPSQRKPFLFDDLFDKGIASYIDCNDVKASLKLKEWVMETNAFRIDKPLGLADKFNDIKDVISKLLAVN